MRHILFADQQKSYKTAILIKDSAFYQTELMRHYVDPLINSGLKPESLIAFSLEYNDAGKAPAGACKKYLENLLPALKNLGVEYIYCADSNYFKALTKSTKSDSLMGYTVPCTVPGFTDMQVIMGMNYQAATYNPLMGDKVTLTIQTLASVLTDTYTELGADIIKWEQYPDTLEEIDKAFIQIMKWPEVAVDIETFSLHAFKAGIGTISFSPDTTGGICFACDIRVEGGENVRFFNETMRLKLRKFFTEYKGKLYYHRANFDVKVLIYNLFMRDPLDTEGMLKGLHIMCRGMEDTRIIAYLALNSCAGNELGLKTLAHEFAGNWAEDSITNILAIPLPKLRRYNIVDTMCTMWVRDKHYPTLVRDGQKKIYQEMMLPSQKTIIQIELAGMPLEPKKVQEAKEALLKEGNAAVTVMRSMKAVMETETILQKAKMEAANAKLKTKQHTIEAFKDIRFNPGSNQQLQVLLYHVMELPVLDKTKTKEPATGYKTLEKLIHHCKDKDSKALLKALIDYGKVVKILSSFIPSFEDAFDKGNGRCYLHGNFNLGGTVSGRLSASEPNLQQLPAGSKYGKLIKKCFSAPNGWIFVGADFNALEDRINALLTMDPNKIKVFTDGYDPHSMRTYAYWPEKFKHLPNTVEGINRIQHEYKDDRSDSKPVSFALQYQGTWATLITNCGFSKPEAQAIEANFHKLYSVSTKWVKDQIHKATQVGYGVGAFGLRIRTPLLGRSVLNTRQTLREAEAEGRTLGNAISGQSYGLLTNRAANKFMERVWVSEFKHDIIPVALIHDAIYLVIRNNTKVIKFVNDNLIDCMSWKGLPEIADPRVPLPANLDLYWPNWASPIQLDNNLTENQIRDAVVSELEERKKK